VWVGFGFGVVGGCWVVYFSGGGGGVVQFFLKDKFLINFVIYIFFFINIFLHS